jgi:hemerythrin-like metal-binding protein
MSVRIDWKESYRTGNAQMDAQHLQWFNQVNDFLKAPDRDSRSIAAKNLYHFTRLHFREEDQLMQLTLYPVAREHTRRHNDTLVHMRLLLEQIAHDTVDMEKWRAFLLDLFLHHITDADLKLAAFVTSQKKAAKSRVGEMDAPWWTALTKGYADTARDTSPGPL